MVIERRRFADSDLKFLEIGAYTKEMDGGYSARTAQMKFESLNVLSDEFVSREAGIE